MKGGGSHESESSSKVLQQYSVEKSNHYFQGFSHYLGKLVKYLRGFNTTSWKLVTISGNLVTFFLEASHYMPLSNEELGPLWPPGYFHMSLEKHCVLLKLLSPCIPCPDSPPHSFWDHAARNLWLHGYYCTQHCYDVTIGIWARLLPGANNRFHLCASSIMIEVVWELRRIQYNSKYDECMTKSALQKSFTILSVSMLACMVVRSVLASQLWSLVLGLRFCSTIAGLQCWAATALPDIGARAD